MFNNIIIKNNKINFFIFLVFIVLTLLVGIHHEPWLDEAQSWLIARDCSFYDMFFNVLKYEGTVFLWCFILRILILCNLPYSCLFLVSCFFTYVGVYILLFKLKIPTLIKIAFIFSFYIFYQYSIVARPYCLIFPILALIVVFYNDRLKRPYLYSFLLILLSSICAYSIVIAIVLLIFFVFDIYKNSNDNIYKYIPALIGCIYIVLIYLLFKKPVDCISSPYIHFDELIPKIFLSVIECYFNLSENFFVIILQLCTIIFFYYVSIKTFCKNIKQIIFFCLINFSINFTFASLHYMQHHLGISILVLLFSYCILLKKNRSINLSLSKNKVFYLLFVILFAFQIFYSYNAFIFDIKNNYSSGKEVANFIKEHNLQNYNIVGIGSNIVTVQPYFNKNIFSNCNTTYWHWKQIEYNNYKKNSLNNNNRIVLIYEKLDDKFIEQFITKPYSERLFYAATFVKNRKIRDLIKKENFALYMKE